jgi:hypothetical protein
MLMSVSSKTLLQHESLIEIRFRPGPGCNMIPMQHGGDNDKERNLTFSGSSPVLSVHFLSFLVVFFFTYGSCTFSFKAQYKKKDLHSQTQKHYWNRQTA